jgi:transposase
MAGAVNYVWNYCNEAAYELWGRRRQWLTAYDLNNLTSGAAKELPINSQTIQAVTKEYVTRRNQFCKRKLRWRTARRSLGWIPFNGQTVALIGERVRYNGTTFRLWFSRPLPPGASIKSGSFTQDARGRWYVHFNIEAEVLRDHGDRDIGVDLNVAEQAVCSDGAIYARENITKRYEEPLAKAQRAHKKKLVKTIHAKIKNTRLDWTHKLTTLLVITCWRLAVGNVCAKALMQTNMAKSVADASWGLLRRLLGYKAISHNVILESVNEAYTTQTCSHCHRRTGPKGIEGLSVRQWICEYCGTLHHRDINSAKNIWYVAWVGPFVEPPQEVSSGLYESQDSQACEK